MIYKWDVTIPQLSGKKTRKGYLYLPKNYGDDPKKHYPVLYMFDGHNVFFDKDATYGKSWGMADYLTRTQKELIVVAIECNHEHNRRLIEYAPLTFENSTVGRIRGLGKIYMEWLVNELKPAIDRRLRTLPDREHTIIGGSSMGGLMSLYAAVEYNHIFQKAACLSPSVWVAPTKLFKMFCKTDIRRDTCIYMDYGSKELFNHVTSLDALTAICHLLLSKQVNLTFRIVPGGMHCEASWEQQIPIFMDCLGI